MQLNIIPGKPNSGKTTIAVGLMYEYLISGKSVYYYTMDGTPGYLYGMLNKLIKDTDSLESMDFKISYNIPESLDKKYDVIIVDGIIHFDGIKSDENQMIIKLIPYMKDDGTMLVTANLNPAEKTPRIKKFLIERTLKQNNRDIVVVELPVVEGITIDNMDRDIAIPIMACIRIKKPKA